MNEPKSKQSYWLSSQGLMIISIAGAALYYFWVEHHSHLIYFLPYLIFLACPFMHFFMHRGHQHGGSGSHETGERKSSESSDSHDNSRPGHPRDNDSQIEL